MDSSDQKNVGWSTSLDLVKLLNQQQQQQLSVSTKCQAALKSLLQKDLAVLAVATEASSHPTGVISLVSQPWLYAGGGLGNGDECLQLPQFQFCLAGSAVSRDATLPFSGLCLPVQCTAHDLASERLLPLLQSYSFLNMAVVSPPITNVEAALEQYQYQYVTAVQRIQEINNFLQTGWTCGEFYVPWNWNTTAPFLVAISVLCASTAIGTMLRRSPKRRTFLNLTNYMAQRQVGVGERSSQNDTVPLSRSKTEDKSPSLLWAAFDASLHLSRLSQQECADTACLDGLRFGSIMWIVLGHVMAIISSTGAGYSNPAQFMPPTGLTTTFIGQLLFSSRLAVDTFLCISGFLVVHVLERKLTTTFVPDGNILRQYVTLLPSIVLSRVARILPLYAATLGFYTQLAPHMGSGPFWYQWLGLLKPCHATAWTNFVFINNFWPPDLAVVDTCFYHSWYLAVDMQLFIAAPLVVLIYKRDTCQGQRAVSGLFLLSVATTIYLSWTRKWSVNTFDGAAVSRYDMEAYAKPHIRAQSYLAGMFVAMVLPEHRWKQRTPWNWKHRCALSVALCMLLVVAFCTVTGAYAQRPCQYKDWPSKGLCGSTWSPMTTFCYVAFSRTVWVVGIAWIMHLCIGQRRSFTASVNPDRACSNNMVASILSWNCWTPLSKLSFGVYLIHPIIIFVWQLGDRDKEVFRLLTFGLDYVSVCVLSYVAALVAAIVVEFPCAAIWKIYVAQTNPQWRQVPETLQATETESVSSTDDSSPITPPLEMYRHSLSISYGATQPVHYAT
jgi:peptidoglycan/LPS O-acetylase OafA/YrhL